MKPFPVRHWLSLRIRLLCTLIFVLGGFLPPYIPKDALAQAEDQDLPDTQQFMLVEDGFLMKSSSLTRAGSRRLFADTIAHTVAEGDTVEKVAQQYNVSPDTVRWANNLSPTDKPKAGGQLIILPVDGILHTVSRGQTLSRIAQLYDIPVGDIAAQNGIEGGFIVVGQQIIVPRGKPIVASPTQVAQKPPVIGGVSSAKPGTKPTPSKPAPPSPGKPSAAVAEPTFGILQMPCEKCAYTQYFRTGHYAVDIQEKGGGPIYASEAGTVIRAESGWNGGYGNVIEVDHGNGLVTLYAHNKELYVKKGDSVTRGQNIAWMGNTGRVYGATGIHIHFEVRVNGVKKNPLLYLQ